MALIAYLMPGERHALAMPSPPFACLTALGGEPLLSIRMDLKVQRVVLGHLGHPSQRPNRVECSSRLRRLGTHAARFGMTDVAALLGKAADALTDPVRRSGESLSHRQLTLACELLGAFGSPTSVPAVAKACGLSDGHLRRAFRACTGLSPVQWRQSHRVAACRQRLAEANTPLRTIAREAGFTVPSHFSRVFAQATGMSPSDWRQFCRAMGCTLTAQPLK